MHAAASYAFHAQTIAVAARTAAADALIATRRADPDTVAAERRGWYGEPESGPPRPESRLVALAGSLGVVSRHASFRSVWFLNATRGAFALAVAVAVADLSGVQHGFWVVLGTVSVLRTSAASTGSTAWRALAGTVVGFAIGAALLAALGTGQVALWVALPIAVCIASYAPGTAPFLVGQAAFTVTVVVLFNLLAPAGWRVGLLRIQDVATRLCGQPGHRDPVLAAGRGRTGRRRPRRCVPPGQRLPHPGGGLGAGAAAGPSRTPRSPP